MKNNGLNLYRVDAESNKALADRFDINSYPTIKWFKKGKFAGSYDYAREAEAIQ
jgi:thioredoxin-like negative regulator of GroEL